MPRKNTLRTIALAVLLAIMVSGCMALPMFGGDSAGKTTTKVAGIMESAGFQIAAQHPEQTR